MKNWSHNVPERCTVAKTGLKPCPQTAVSGAFAARCLRCMVKAVPRTVDAYVTRDRVQKRYTGLRLPLSGLRICSESGFGCPRNKRGLGAFTTFPRSHRRHENLAAIPGPGGSTSCVGRSDGPVRIGGPES